MNMKTTALAAGLSAILLVGATAKAMRYDVRFSKSPEHSIPRVMSAFEAAGWRISRAPNARLIPDPLLPQRVFKRPDCETPIVVSILHSGPQLIPFLRQAGFQDLSFVSDGRMTTHAPTGLPEPGSVRNMLKDILGPGFSGTTQNDGLPLMAVWPGSKLTTPGCQLNLRETKPQNETITKNEALRH